VIADSQSRAIAISRRYTIGDFSVFGRASC
jgi:hypothetical protein